MSSDSATVSTDLVLPWKFDNLALHSLPIDPLPWDTPGSRNVPNACFSRVRPTPVQNPQMVAYSLPAMNLLFTPNCITDAQIMHPTTVEELSGCVLIPGSEPAAHCYCGHQFGSFAGQLGDGAAMYLGEMVNGKGERWELQLKGAGKTPYSRMADGQKVLRSSIREFLCSEAMHALGVPTTRAATCITSDSRIERDIFYTGNSIMERCTVVSRIAPTFIRFGSFEICKPLDRYTGRQGPSVGNRTILPQLLRYVVKNFYPEIWSNYASDDEEKAVSDSQLRPLTRDFILEVTRRTARLVALWQTVGFCHGVLNTDNMSILGLTIDYGPFGFMDRYDPNFICNTSDEHGRYCYSAQPEICLWNCLKLREALLDLLTPEGGQSLLNEETMKDTYHEHYDNHYTTLMRAKLGFLTSAPATSESSSTSGDEDTEIFKSLFKTMEESGSDFTLTFLSLTDLMRGWEGAPSFYTLIVDGGNVDEAKIRAAAEYIVHRVCYSLEELLEGMVPVFSEMDAMILALYSNNPAMLNRLGGDRIFRSIKLLEKKEAMQEMTEDEKRTQDVNLWTNWLITYLRRLRADHDQYSATTTANSPDWLTAMREQMSRSNPRVVLRNHFAQLAIQWADQKQSPDFSGVQHLLARLMRPFNDNAPGEDMFQATGFTGPVSSSTMDEEACASGSTCTLSRPEPCLWLSRPPRWANKIRVSCSS